MTYDHARFVCGSALATQQSASGLVPSACLVVCWGVPMSFVQPMDYQYHTHATNYHNVGSCAEGRHCWFNVKHLRHNTLMRDAVAAAHDAYIMQVQDVIVHLRHDGYQQHASGREDEAGSDGTRRSPEVACGSVGRISTGAFD